MNFGLPRLTFRQLLVVVHDLVATAAAILASFYLRFETDGLMARLDGLHLVLPLFLVYAAVVYQLFGLYKGKWRFASLPDLSNIFRAVTVLAVSLLVLDYILVAPNFLGTFFFGKLTIILYWFLQMFFLGGPRIAYRYFRYTRTRQQAMSAESTPTLCARPRRRRRRAAARDRERRGEEDLAGRHPVAVTRRPRPDDARRGGAGRSRRSRTRRRRFAGRGRPVARLVLTPTALEPEVQPETILMKAKRLGLVTSRLPSLDEGGEALRLAPVNVEDLLLRLGVKIDYQRLEAFVRGKAIIVTGGGGSIGSEICDRIVTFGAARLLVIENSEPALHAVLEIARRQIAAAPRSKAGSPTCATATASSA